MRTDRRTDMTKLIVAFRNFSKASKNYRKDPVSGCLSIKKPTSQYTNRFLLRTDSANDKCQILETLQIQKRGQQISAREAS